MSAELLDAAVSGNTDDQSYPVSSGSNRCLVVGTTDEADIPLLNDITVTWGGQPMTKAINIICAASTLSNDATLFYLLEAGIAAASGSTIAITGQGSKYTWNAVSYININQTGGATTLRSTSSDENNAATPNPFTTVDINGLEKSVVVALAGVGQTSGQEWNSGTNPLTELTNQPASSSAQASMAHRLLAVSETASVRCTWDNPNRHCICAMELTGVDPAAGGDSVIPQIMHHRRES